jgi:hypothetical protein
MKTRRIAVTILILGLFACRVRGQISDGSNAQDDAERQLRDKQRQSLEEAVSKSKLEELVAESKLTGDLLDHLSKEADKYLPRLDALMTNDDGRRIAMDDVAFLNVIEIETNPLVTKDQISAKVTTVNAISQALTNALADTKVGMIPPASIVEQLADAKEWAKDSLVKVQTNESMLDAAIAKVPKDTNLQNTPTLKERIGTYQLAQMDFLNRSRIGGEEAAKPEAQQKMTDAGRQAELLRAQEESDRLLRDTRAELERMRIENEMQLATLKEEQAEREAVFARQLAEAQASRAVSAAQDQVIVEKAAQDAELTKKRQECHDPKVTSVLAPFLSIGYFQPKTGRGIDAKPMSLAELRAVGALEPTKHGIERLMDCADWPQSDRPGWGRFRSVAQASNDQVEMVKQAQGYLNDLGEALVAEKMLSP